MQIKPTVGRVFAQKEPLPERKFGSISAESTDSPRLRIIAVGEEDPLVPMASEIKVGAVILAPKTTTQSYIIEGKSYEVFHYSEIVVIIE